MENDHRVTGHLSCALLLLFCRDADNIQILQDIKVEDERTLISFE